MPSVIPNLFVSWYMLDSGVLTCVGGGKHLKTVNNCVDL